jgi:hypothetical protein
MHRFTAVIATAVPPFAIALLLGPLRKAERPVRGPIGPTYAFTVGCRIVLVRDDGAYTMAALHPTPLFGLCTGGH